MKISLPVIEERFTEDGGIQTKESTIECELNLSRDAQITWENNFPEFAKHTTLEDYVKRMDGVVVKDAATRDSVLKMVYSYMLFDNEMNFRQFLRMFTCVNTKYLTKLYRILTNALQAINDRENPKKNS